MTNKFEVDGLVVYMDNHKPCKESNINEQIYVYDTTKTIKSGYYPVNLDCSGYPVLDIPEYGTISLPVLRNEDGF